MRLKALLIYALLAYGCGASGPNTPTSSENVPLGKLPDTVVPTSYTLDLTLIPERDHFDGHATIAVDIHHSTDHIWLHGRDLTVTEAKLVEANGETVPMTYREVDPSGVARLDLPKRIRSGKAQLEFTYTAPYNRSLEGIYKVEEGGHAYVFSQMEPISARLAFPGFDEPRFKTPYDVTLTVPAGDTAVTNTPIASETKLAGGLKRLKFKETKPLPTYLLAFIVGDLDVVDGPTIPPNEIRDHPIPLRGIAAKGKGAQLTYMLDRAGAVVAALERYFGRPYPFAKLDVIAAVDFAAGAMENAGAITYREQSILVGKDAPLAQKRNVLVTLAHELSHQWFGDLVTPAWWDDIWLNESFATWMSYRTLNELYPGDHYDRDMQRYAMRAFQADRLTTARQIRQPVTDANGIVTVFDGITYAKGGAVLRMMENYLGARQFRAGIRAYLNKFAFGTATANDLIQSIAEAMGVRHVKSAFNSFLDQAGLPLLDVTRNCDKFGAGQIVLEQSRYLPLGSKGSSDRRWTLPVCLSLRRDDAATRQCLMMTRRRTAIDIPAGQCPAAIMPNAMGAGYYRWQLDTKSWDDLLAVLPQLPAQEQLSVADSLSAAFQAGRISKADYISRAALLARSDYWDVMSEPMETLGFIVDYLTPENGKTALRESLGGFYSSRLRALGLDATTELDRTDPIAATRMRSSAVGFLATVAKDEALRAELATRAQAFLGMGGDGQLHRDAIAPDLVDVALRVGAEDLGPGFIDALLKRLVASQDGNLRNEILVALGHTITPSKIGAVRALALSDAIRNNEARRLIEAEMDSAETRPGAWDWLREHYKELSARYAKWTEQDLISAEQGFCSPARRSEIETFFKPRIADIEGGQRALDNTLETIDLCIAMKGKYGDG